MDSDKPLPSIDPQVGPQQPEIPTPEVPQQSPAPPHPEQKSPNASQENYKRPISAWQPKVEAETNLTSESELPKGEAVSVGTEVLQTLQTVENPQPEPATNITPMVNTEPALNGIIGPTDTLEPQPKTEVNPMSDNQAQELFKEEPLTKKHFKTLRFKKALKVGLSALVLILIITTGYLFLAGNHAANSYKKSSSLVAYKDSFQGLTESLSKTPVDSNEVEAQFNKLKVLEGNSNRLSSVFGGSLNPKYKKAQQLQSLEESYTQKASAYQDKFADYPTFISTLSESYSLLGSLDNFNKIDYKVETAESLRSNLQKTYKDCTNQIKTFQETAKPSNLSSASQQLEDSLKEVCTEGRDSLQNGPLATLSDDKVGILTPEVQETLKTQITRIINLAGEVLNGSGTDSFELNSLSAYQRESLSEATNLKDAAEALLAT